ncbi:hypothetical protein FACS1894181_11710 [Bacteroidia bacterium]|nr:hypothetical protein FACS1894181_11710 [Bacteroidia bacterium]
MLQVSKSESSGDWVDSNKLRRHANINTTVLYLTGTRERFGFGPAPTVLPADPPTIPDFESGAIPPALLTGNMTQGNWLDTVFMPAFNNYNTAFDAWENPVERTRAKTLTFNTAEDIFIPLYRKLYGFIKGHPLVTDTDLAEMMFPVPHRTRTPAPVPASFPEGSVTHPAPATVVISFRDSESKKVRKPAGVHGAEIAWAILDEAPQGQDWAKLTHSSFDTASPFTLTFTGPERGKELYFALRWENTRGEKGPWSDIQQTIIS